jgi:exosortase D (VPLPA-CTERM-specific)
MRSDSGTRFGLASPDAVYRIVIVCLLAVAMVIGFGGSLLQLVHRWHTQEEYSYGYLIPLIVAWLLWSRRAAIGASIGSPSWMGPGLILIAALMHVIGKLSALFVLSQIAFIVVLFGVVLGLGGRPLFKVVFVPLLFLVFAIPLPFFIEASLSWRLQILSSQLGVYFIRLLDIPVFLQGNVIDLGTYKLQVVDACSGLRYLYPLMSLSFLAAYLFQTRMWQRILIFLSATPITIVMNSFRIGMVGVLVDHFGPQDAEGALHMFEGWVIFLACACILIGEMSLLARFASGKGFFELFYPPVITAPSRLPGSRSRLSQYAPIIGCLVLVSATGFAGIAISSRTEVYPQREDFATFPNTLGAWTGQSSTLSNDIKTHLGFTDYILSDYVKPGGRPVNFYVAYYASQRSGFSPHSPSVCIPGNGWRITEFARTHYRHNHISLPINRAVIMRESNKELVYYWYNERGMNIANEYLSKLLLLKDAIFKNRTDGALIRLMTPIYTGESEHDADQRLQRFLNIVEPVLAKYLPTKSGKLASAMPSVKATNR